jgi:ribosomal protein S25
MKKYIKKEKDGKYYIAHDKSDINDDDFDISSMKVNHFYKMGGFFYQYYGEEDKFTEDELSSKTGFFLSYIENDDGIIEPELQFYESSEDDRAYNEHDLVERSTNTDVTNKDEYKNKLLENIKSMNTRPKKNKYENTKKAPKKKIRCLKNDTRNKKDDKIKIAIEDDDEVFVRVLKEVINSSNITLNDIYEYFGNQQGYNLFYGLNTRSAISEQSLAKWCEFLGCEYMLVIRKKDNNKKKK